MKKIISIFLIFIALGIVVGISSCKKEESVLIYTSTEDYNMELMQKRLNEKFPKYKIEIEYMSTSTVATKVLEEGEKCEADIVYALEYSYIEKIVKKGNLADLTGEFELSKFLDDMISPSIKNYSLPNQRVGGAIIINKSVLNQNHLPVPTSYNDLLKPEYKNLISMPSPSSSGTGYMFYLSLVNAWGEEKAVEYFDKLAPNIIQFTSSGSGPINALVAREAAIGLGMLTQATEKINSGNKELEILFFDEGAPFGLYGMGVVKGKETKTAVMEVMEYLSYDYNMESCSLYYPEPIFKDVIFDVANFPKNIVYSDMSNNSPERKEHLLQIWKH